MKFLAGALLVTGVVFAFVAWLNWWLPQMQAAVGR